MNNFVELNQEELTEVSGGFCVLFGVIVATELLAGAAAGAYLYIENAAMDAMGGEKYPGVAIP